MKNNNMDKIKEFVINHLNKLPYKRRFIEGDDEYIFDIENIVSSVENVEVYYLTQKEIDDQMEDYPDYYEVLQAGEIVYSDGEVAYKIEELDASIWEIESNWKNGEHTSGDSDVRIYITYLYAQELAKQLSEKSQMGSELVKNLGLNTRTIKALCLQDYGSPETNYATLMELGIKTIETRVWGTKYRGDLLIVCAKSAKSPNAGLALCVVNLSDIQVMTEEHEDRACIKVYPKAKAWLTENLRPLSRKFPVKSKLSIFEVELPEDVTYESGEKGYWTVHFEEPYAWSYEEIIMEFNYNFALLTYEEAKAKADVDFGKDTGKTIIRFPS